MSAVTAAAALLTVVDVIDETNDAKSVVLRPGRDDAPRFAYRPGQFLTLRVGSGERIAARSYSLSSSPTTDPELKVTVKRTEGGYGSNWICDHVAVGDEILALPPAGRFTPRDLGADLLLFAAGSGITPMMSIIKEAHAAGSGRVTLVYANARRDGVIFAEALDELGRTRGGRLTAEHWIGAEAGRLSAEQVAEYGRRHPADEVLVCGPAGFMDVVRAGLAAAGIPRDHVRQEVFASISGDPFAPADVPERAETTADGALATVLIGGDTFELTWPRQQNLVQVLLERGVDVPYSCRSGECGSCACSITSGEVRMEHSGVLDEEDIASGYVLGCQAHPVSDAVSVSFT